MEKHGETLADVSRRYHQGKTRKPLRTFTEMAEEFEVTKRKLETLMRNSNIPAPKSVMYARGSVKNVWYDPEEVRKWWRLVNSKGE